MSSAHRKLAKLRLQKPVAAPTGFDLSHVRPLDFDTIEVDVGDDLVTAELLLPVGNGETYAVYSETIDLGQEGQAPPYLRHAARELVNAMVSAIRERVMLDAPLPCASCNSNCCRNSDIPLTAADIDKLKADGISLDSFTLYDTATVAGHVGQFVMVDADEGNMCIHLREDGCSIYENRPTVCREYSAWECEDFVEDEAKKEGRVSLRVIT